MSGARYRPGGPIEGAMTATIHPDECVLAPTDINAPQRMHCIRPDHRHLKVRREVVPDGAGWSVTHSTFSTTDHDLAVAVRAELDAIDPVQGELCRHAGERVEARRLCDPAPTFLCVTCDSRLDAEGRML